MRSLLPNYLGQRTQTGVVTAARMMVALIKDDIDGLFSAACLLKVPIETVHENLILV